MPEPSTIAEQRAAAANARLRAPLDAARDAEERAPAIAALLEKAQAAATAASSASSAYHAAVEAAEAAGAEFERIEAEAEQFLRATADPAIEAMAEKLRSVWGELRQVVTTDNHAAIELLMNDFRARIAALGELHLEAEAPGLAERLHRERLELADAVRKYSIRAAVILGATGARS